MTELKDLLKQRATVRGRVTLFEKYLTPLMSLDSVTERNKLINNELSLRLSKFQELSYTFDEIQTKIEALDSDTSKQMEEREQTENQFFQLIGTAQEYLDAFTNSKIKQSDEVSCRGSSTSVTNHVKLPPLKIPPFSGDTNKWLQFRDMYISLIHNNDNLDNISKFHYLKSYLEGSALAVINSVSVSSDNYQIAWSLLCDRYNNKRLLINEHIKCLFSIEALSKESDRGLRNLVDAISKNLSALKLLGEPTDSWGTLIIYIGSSKLDSVTARNWEEHRSKLETNNLDDFFDFLRKRATVLETVYAAKTSNTQTHNNKVENRQTLNRSKSFISSSLDSHPRGCCLACKQDHKLYECNKFKSMSVEERIAKVYQWKLCSNCLRSDHQTYHCRLAGCRICKRKHNTLLHKVNNLPSGSQPHQTQSSSSSSRQDARNNVEASTSTSMPTSSVSNVEIPTNNTDNASSCPRPAITLSAGSSGLGVHSTAIVEVSNNGNIVKLRALLDNGAQSSFITEAARAKLGCPIIKEHECVYGLKNASVNIVEHCNIKIRSTYTSYTTNVKCYILPVVTGIVPQNKIRVEELDIPGHIQLADPDFHLPGDVDILLGLDIFWDVLGTSQIKLGPNKPVLHETEFGWILGGRNSWKIAKRPSKSYCYFSQDIQQQLTKFWELEEVPKDKPTSNSDQYCEALFQETTQRDEDGRFCVQIPLRDSPDVLGDSFKIAERRLHQMERKMKQKPELKQEYTKFMQEYERLGHMSEVPKPEPDPTDLYPLCPGHFLIGKPLTSLPSPALTELNPNRLRKYEQIEQIRQQFWERWRTEYLNELQQRSKWRITQGKLAEGDMVVLKEANLPPLKWRMGRIHRLYPGADGIARVADVNTSKGLIRRAVTNLCPLPNDECEEATRKPTVSEGGKMSTLTLTC
ncbi:uncharacterized protein LOC125239480 [Leguminivora glycinivorella]|uniref:uncharacterized protein LOC125239480 n=1 Tax=Leguminivora glycinivorella TaxID=1035111 RepID=UPI0020104301|nr:uncharacterized protein LOC125239480 [Leguminivora glycinivorella]